MYIIYICTWVYVNVRCIVMLLGCLQYFMYAYAGTSTLTESLLDVPHFYTN